MIQDNPDLLSGKLAVSTRSTATMTYAEMIAGRTEGQRQNSSHISVRAGSDVTQRYVSCGRLGAATDQGANRRGRHW